MHIRPVDLARVRNDTARCVAISGPHIYGHTISKGTQVRPLTMSDQEAAAHLTRAEVNRLARAELFHVSESMTQVAKAAASSLPEFTLTAEDLPAPYGFVYFADAVAVAEDHLGHPCLPITAVSWGPWRPNERAWPDGGIWVTWYSDVVAEADSGLQRGTATAEQVAEVRARYPSRLALDTDSQIPFCSEPVPVRGVRDNTWESVLRSVWLLMSQSLASVEPARYDRASRRRYQREGTEPPEVRVITLRRPRNSDGEHSDSGREYHHQWIVRGHWRQQWYATRQVHRPVWIAPHIKGPEGAPILGGEKVYALRR